MLRVACSSRMSGRKVLTQVSHVELPGFASLLALSTTHVLTRMCRCDGSIGFLVNVSVTNRTPDLDRWFSALLSPSTGYVATPIIFLSVARCLLEERETLPVRYDCTHSTCHVGLHACLFDVLRLLYHSDLWRSFSEIETNVSTFIVCLSDCSKVTLCSGES